MCRISFSSFISPFPSILITLCTLFRPVFAEEDGVLDISQGRHPLVSRVLQQMSNAEYVANDTQLRTDGTSCMILTGPNMGGKSCFLSQVAIIVILAQIGSFVPAARAKLSIFDSIFIRYLKTENLF